MEKKDKMKGPHLSTLVMDAFLFQFTHSFI